MKLSQSLMMLAACAISWGCLSDYNPTACRSSDTRSAQQPGTKIAKEDSKDLCACEAVANEFSACCDGCAFGDQVVCRSSTIMGPDGFGINVCAGKSEETEPDPRCSLVDGYTTATLNPQLTYVGNNNSGPSNFQWGWYNEHTTELADSATLIQDRRIPEQLVLQAKHSDGMSQDQEDVGWDDPIAPCEIVPESKTLDLNEEGAWYIALENLPGIPTPYLELRFIDSISP